ncbi:divalent-cation tolerance protein CutA [Erythrobacter dokdonensis]|uniref:Periplasmic divalent cation tolerance protein n=1 Tax=Erythrobacter dokdonensis DSW-74 TaxID=1300349 RepID=A0A1A7BGD5_9SPHN|nr:divalent-cation tolerance protein CutA [Erythrobacter dokdonensis]OBV10796.1 Periplasmic divalent cation tolerance protein [Erythrobacter dokdonensis DSW-74]
MTTANVRDAALIWCPFPDREAARAIAGQLLDERLVACANIIGEVESLFVWQGTQGTGSETGVLFKTTAARLNEAVARLGKLHPYDTPAVIGWRCDAAHPATLTWLSAACSGSALGDFPEERGD